MEVLSHEIARCFGGDRPDAKSLVVMDGFDGPEKERAVAFYSGKTWADVLEHLRNLKNEQVFGAAFYLEEWSVLAKDALGYYLRAHLEFLLENLYSPHPNEEFIAAFGFELYQVVYMHKGSPFSVEQTRILKKVAGVIQEEAQDQQRFEYAGGQIAENAGRFITELEKYQ